MASGIYTAIRNQMGTAAFDWTSGTYAIMLVSSSYTPNFDTDATLNDVPSGAQLLTAVVNLASNAVSGGFCKAANVAWTSLTTSGAVAAVLIVKTNGGAQSTYELVAFIDQGTGFGQSATSEPANVIFDTRGIFQP